MLQVHASRQLPTNPSGSEVFERIREGNGTFVTATSGNLGGGINQGSGVIDQGSVTNLSAWECGGHVPGTAIWKSGFRLP